MQQDTQDPIFIREIIDGAKTVAFQRGEDVPNWSDIWRATLQIHDLRHVVSARNVDINGLNTDLKYASNFGLANDSLVREHGLGLSGVDQVRHEASKQISRMSLPELGPIDLKNVKVDELIKDVVEKIIDQFKYKHTDLGETFSNLEFSLADEIFEGAILNNITIDELKRIIADRTLDEVWPEITKYFSEKINNFETVSPIEMLKQMGDDDLSPFETVSLVLALSGRTYAQLLIRNGELVNDPDYQDTISQEFPSKQTKRLALNALSLAYEKQSKAMDIRHVVAWVVDNDAECREHLSNLGIPDLRVFSEKYKDQVFDTENTSEDTVRQHPQINTKARTLLTDIEKFCTEHQKDKHWPSKLLQHLLQKHKETRTALRKAGLNAGMLKAWEEPYPLEDRDDYKVKPKKPFKISSDDLKTLTDQYCVDYTQLAGEDKFDPMIGNERALTEVETTLLKKGKKNPMVIGEPGIGKTKILEGFADRIVSGKCPKRFFGAQLLYLDLHKMNDSPYRGVFEKHLTALLGGVAERNAQHERPPIILGIDEFAGAKDAGSASSAVGAAEIMKPYLTSGDLYVIGTTTEKEFQTQIETDSALARRFNVVKLHAPNIDQTIDILRGLKKKYTSHHGLRIRDELLETATELAERYIHRVNHPDKTIDLLDHACAIAKSEQAKSLKKEHLIQATSHASGVPLEFLRASDTKRYAELPKVLQSTILEQDEAVLTLSASIQRAKAGLTNPETPIGSFLFVGPTGVGKTELAKCLAQELYGSEEFLLRYDMSEFQNKENVSRFVGAPPGYVGYDEGGGLVTDVRARPYSVILYDEIEKAHPDITNALLGPFSNGIMTDGRGIQANMRHTINIMTSNIGAQDVMAGNSIGLHTSEDTLQWSKDNLAIYQEAVEKYFRPEFLNRLDAVIYFNNLSRDAVGMLVDRQISQTQKQLISGEFNLDLQIGSDVRDRVLKKGYDPRYGARPLKRAWNDIVVTPLSRWLLSQSPRRVKRADTVTISEGAKKSLDFDLG